MMSSSYFDVDYSTTCYATFTFLLVDNTFDLNHCHGNNF